MADYRFALAAVLRHIDQLGSFSTGRVGDIALAAVTAPVHGVAMRQVADASIGGDPGASGSLTGRAAAGDKVFLVNGGTVVT